jgi:UDP-glucuronate 4-epimerase
VATYLVTGVAGFIASKVAEQLLAAGHTVVGLDNLNDYYDVRLKDYRLSRLLDVSWPLSGARAVGGALRPDGFGLGSDPKRSAFAGNHQPATNNSGKFTFLPLDIENLPVMEEVFKTHKFDAVFNLAARAGVRYSLEFPELYRRTNVLGEENVLKCQVRYGVKKHVLASSSSVYAGCPMPFTEDAQLGKMQSPYAETKHHAEMEAYGYHRVYGLDVTVLRYFTVFGPAGRPDMAPFRFIKWIDEGTPITLYGDGSQARDFTYVDDIARGTILAAKPLGYEVINLGGGNNPLTITAMILIIENALNTQVSGFRSQVSRKALINRLPSSPADMKETWADISKAKRLLGWAPQVSSKDGFRRAVEWHVQNREWLKAVKP